MTTAAGTQSSAGTPAALAYLVSQYPTISHTFVLREIRGLRAAGLTVHVASVRGADRDAGAMSPREAEEFAATRYLRAQRKQWPALHVGTLLGRPGPYLRTFFYAIALAGWDIRQLLRHLLFFADAVAVGAWFRGTGARHLHTHFASTAALLAARLFGFPFSITVHGSDEFRNAESFLMREKTKRARLIVAISNYGRSQVMLNSAYQDWHKVRVVRLGVDPAEYSRAETQAGALCEVITVGRLSPPKALPMLLTACAELLREGFALRLRLVGDGPERPLLESVTRDLGIEQHVVFEGALSHDRVLEIYRRADIFALSSFAEGVPVVLMEAMALEIPCVATRITGVPELIRDEEEGLLVPPADTQELKTAIARLLQDPELRRRLGRAAREKVARDYNIHANIAQLAQLFRDECL